jgi:hypothetical protein
MIGWAARGRHLATLPLRAPGLIVGSASKQSPV